MRARGDLRPIARVCALALVLSAGCTDTTGPEDTSAPPEVVFSTWEASELGPGIFRATLDGSAIQRIADRTAEFFAVSPAGDVIAFAGRVDGGLALFTIGVDGSNERRLTPADHFIIQPTWSPDGSRIAFTSFGASETGIWVVNADGSDLRPLIVTEDGFAGAAAWSNDGTRLAYSWFSSDNRGLFVANADGSDPRKIHPESAGRPDWSPDDSELLVLNIGDDVGNRGIVRIAADGSELLSLTPTSVNVYAVARWSPDGNTILFVESGLHTSLKLMDRDGLNVREIPVPDSDALVLEVDWLP